MTGLPAKYAKMGFSKGWKAFRASKGKGKKTTIKRAKRRKKVTSKKRRRTTARKDRPVMARRRKKSSRRGFAARIGRANIGSEIQTIGMGAAGAIGGTMLSNAVPMDDARIKAAIPLIGGVILSLFIGKKKPLFRKIGLGMSIGGALSLVRAVAPGIPLLAGDEPGQIEYTPADVEQALITGQITPEQAQALVSPELMGAPAEYAGDDEEDETDLYGSWDDEADGE